jgi:hypothetical protein
MTTTLTRARSRVAFAAILLALSAAYAHHAAAQEFGYEIKCKTSWERIPNGGHMPDRPGYRIAGRKCVGVPKQPSYLKKPRNPVRIKGRVIRR